MPVLTLMIALFALLPPLAFVAALVALFVLAGILAGFLSLLCGIATVLVALAPRALLRE